MASFPISTLMNLWDICTFPKSWEDTNRPQILECGNKEGGRAVPFLGIFVSNFRYTVQVWSENNVLNHKLYTVSKSSCVLISIDPHCVRNSPLSMYFSSRLTSVSRRLEGGQLTRQQFMSEVDSCLTLIQEGEYSPFPFLQNVSQEVRKKFLLWKFLNCKLQKKIGSANRKSANCHIWGWSANLTNYLSLQICGFSICGSYLQTSTKKISSLEVFNLQITKKEWIRKSQIRKVSHLRKVRKFNKLFKSANLRICDLGKLFADRQHMFILWVGSTRWL